MPIDQFANPAAKVTHRAIIVRHHGLDLSGLARDAADVIASCNSMGLFGGERLVVVEEVERWKAADVKELAAYLAAPAPATVLARSL